MRIAFGVNDDFAGFDYDRLFADDIGEAPALSDHMIRDQMLGTRQNLRQDQLLRWRLGDPRYRGHDVKERRARQTYSSQDIG
jgi:hypothetical protein